VQQAPALVEMPYADRIHHVVFAQHILRERTDATRDRGQPVAIEAVATDRVLAQDRPSRPGAIATPTSPGSPVRVRWAAWRRAVLARVVDPHDAPLRDALLSLSPTLVQCIPAISERWRSRTAAGSPSLFASGGMLDSCYMWRRGGFLSQRIEAELRTFRASRQDGRDSKL